MFTCPKCGSHDYYESKENGRIRVRCKECQKKRMRKIYATDEYKAKHKIDDRRRRRGFSDEEYNAMLVDQKGCCAICGAELWDKLFADHRHDTMQPRGLLCNRCNVGIGMFKDDPAYLRAAADYLERTERSEP